MTKTSNLSINVPGVASLQQYDARSGLASPHTPRSPPPPSNAANGAVENNKAQYGDGYDNHVHSPINALPPPPSPRSPKPGSVTAKIFGNKLASKSSTKLHQKTAHADFSPQQPSIGGKSPANNSSAQQLYLNNNPGGTLHKSSPDVSVSHPHSGQSSPDAVKFSPDQLASSTLPYEKEKAQSRKTQHKFGNFLNRKSSLRGDEQTISVSTPTELLPPRSARGRPKPGPIKAITQPIDVPVRTAPVEKERGFRSAMNSALRNRSLDRADTDNERISFSQHSHKPPSLGPNGITSSSHGSVMSNLRSGSTRAAEGINKARKGLFGNFKLNRSGSSHEREPLRNEPYELKVLVLPLEEQARITRIAKRLHYCKDKTEFWLPAFPYRCIDYLSDRGTYSEGLYRVPGSELEIKHYMARFDREYDIDLFDQEDLHDVNVVATMLKRWLSNLPPVLSPTTQSDIITRCSKSHPAVPGGTTPTYMKDALSNLPPWNYYLLFAITGHISFLHNHREQNKMTYENLFRCFATRALQVEPYIFWWLVWDWRGCWAGCAREDEFKVEEYKILDKMADEEKEAAQKERAPVKKDSKEEKDLKQQEKERKKVRVRKASKHSVSALSKQSVSSREREREKNNKSRPQTAHPHPHSSATNKSQPHLPPRSRSREDKNAASKDRTNTDREQHELERGREREREREGDKDRALSSSDSSKSSITGQSSAGMTEKDEDDSSAPQGGDKAGEGGSANANANANGNAGGKLKSTEMGLPMLSPLKPLSPLGLH